MYPNIMLDQGIRAIRHKFLDRDSESPSVECIIDAIKIITTCSNIQFKGRLPSCGADPSQQITDN